jgi:hypothetical protein
MALTDRQKEIKGLLDKGKTPKEIGAQLGISENAVYQQRRRIKAAQGSPRRGSAKRADEGTRVRAAAARAAAPKQQRKRSAPAPAAANGNSGTTQAPADPLGEVRRRKAEIDSWLTGTKATLDDAAAAHEAAQKAHSEAEAKVQKELEQLAAVEAVLTGKLAPPKPQQRRKPAEKPAEAPAPAPEPPAAEAEAQDQAAEAPDEPTEVQPSDNGGEPEMERAGVPTVPEFAQEDAFASSRGE